MSNEELIQHCAPTLANMKIGSLFTVRFQEVALLKARISAFRRQFYCKGLDIRLLKTMDGTALVYVYRRKKLQKHLAESAVQEFLGEFGYTNFTVSSVLSYLKLHLGESIFPHEIGVFLGYPLEDIRGFIQHKGKNFQLTGIWKVYHEPEKAEKTFRQYKKCVEVYKRCLEEGFDMSRLVVAG